MPPLPGPDPVPAHLRPDPPPITFREFLNRLGPNRKVNKTTIGALRAAYNRKYGGRARPAPAPKPPSVTTPGKPGGPAGSPSSPPAPSFDPRTLPGNALIEDRIIDFDQQIANLPARFNAARRGLAANTGADLAESGFFEDVDLGEQNIGGNLVFALQGQGRGRAFTGAVGGIKSAAAARGALNSSFARDQANEATRQLDTQSARALRSFGGQQAALDQDQADSLTQLMGGRLDARRDLADFQANSKAIPPPAPPTPQNVGAAKPGPGSGELPRSINFAGGNLTTLQNKLNGRFGAGVFDVKKRGPKVGGFIAVRR